MLRFSQRILTVRRFRVSCGPVARYGYAFSYEILWGVIFLKDKSMRTISRHLGHFTSMIPEVGEILSKILHSHFGHFTMIFTACFVVSIIFLSYS